MTARPRDGRRKERREGILLAICGAAFVGAGVLLCVIGRGWLGGCSIAFGAASAILGFVQASGSHGRRERVAIILGCLAYALAGLFALLAAVVSPESWGWRGSGAGIVVGVLFLGFFGPGAVLLAVKEVRRGRRPPRA